MKQRILTAVIGIIIIVPIIIYGNWPFIAAAYLFATIALIELTRMFHIQRFPVYFIISVIFLWLLLIPVEFEIMSYVLTKYRMIIALTSVLLLLMVLSKNRFSFDQASQLLLSTIFIGAAFYFLIIVRMEGLNYFLFILFTIWATDSGAYFIGRRFGKRKLWPAISPNKTIGGAIGGLTMGIIVAVLFHLIYPFEKSLLSIVILAISISIIGQIGDLVASAIKRNYNVKDYGNIFPGHGGVLDRLDSFLFVLFILQLFNVF